MAQSDLTDKVLSHSLIILVDMSSVRQADGLLVHHSHEQQASIILFSTFGSLGLETGCI